MIVRKVKKSDIKFENGVLYFRGAKCKLVTTHSRDVFVCERYGIVLKYEDCAGDDSQNYSEYRTYRTIKKRHRKLLKHFVPCLGYFQFRDRYLEQDYSFSVQPYIKFDKRKRFTEDQTITMIGVVQYLNLADIDPMDPGCNVAINTKTGKPVIFDLGCGFDW
jgi:hypothetical protein